MADTKVGRLGVLIVIACFIFIEVIYVYNALSKPRLIIDPKVKILVLTSTYLILKRSYSDQLTAARLLVQELEKLEKIEKLDPNDPKLDSLGAAMKMNLAELQAHQLAKDNGTRKNDEYSQRKYYSNTMR